jgi:hypothetical protein
MAIDVPTGALGRINIPWMTTDPTGWAKVARAQREAAGLAQLAGGLRRGVSNYMKGGLRGVVDPQYAAEQEEAGKEDAELSARLGGQEDKAAQQSQQPVEQGTPSVEPTVKPEDKDVAETGPLPQLSSAWDFVKKIYTGPGKRIDLGELARKRGMIERQEDITKRIQAVSPAFRYSQDPGGDIARFVREGWEGLRGIKPKPPKEPEALARDPIYQEIRAAEVAAGRSEPGISQAGWAEYRKRSESEQTRQRQEAADIQHKYDVPENWDRARESLVQEGNRNPTDMDIAKRVRKMFGPFPGQRGGGPAGGGVAGQAAQQKHDAAQAYLRRGLDRDPTEEEISLLQQGLAKTGDADKLLDWGFLPKDFDLERVLPPKLPKGPGAAAGKSAGRAGQGKPYRPGADPGPPGADQGPGGHGTAGGGLSEQQPDAPPKQTDQRIGEPDRNPARPTEHRKTYNKPEGAPAGKPKPDVPIWQ